ncbi:mRNA decapping enzyme [Cetacean poxvirus 1]|nr:mRNA decapping enzyme [Cetacean poxvirus 1]
MNTEPSKVLLYIMKNNRSLSRTYVWESTTQRISVKAFSNQFLWCPRRISVCAILSTNDDKFLACLRRHSFLFTEIIRTKNIVRKERLLLKHGKFLRKAERKMLCSEFSMLPDDDHDHNDVIFPGGIPLPGEDVISCLSREIKEETNLDREYIYLDSRFFVYASIEDLLIDRMFEALLFLGNVNLTSCEIQSKFSENNEVSSLEFLDPVSGEGLQCDLVRYVLSISRMKCSGNKGYIKESL